MGVLDGKVALTPGGGRGIGREICLSMAAAGARVVVVDDAGMLRDAIPHKVAEQALPALTPSLIPLDVTTDVFGWAPI